ncbi:MAG: P1 family peptidase [Parvularculaceae bacterium]
MIRYSTITGIAAALAAFCAAAAPASAQERARARDLGIAPGVMDPGPLNAITDVAGVAVGHVTVIEGDHVRTGATAILPHQGNLYRGKIPAAIVIGNGYGKLAGYSQVHELGEIEAPIVLTNTLNVAEGIAAAVEWSLDQPGNEQLRSVNTVVGETNDGYLNDIRGRHLTPDIIRTAIEDARPGPVEEGSVGAGTGTSAFGFKGGIGTSSRRLGAAAGGYTVGVLVQSNYGGVLKIDGAPFGRDAARERFRERGVIDGDGSIMMVVATDAPLSDRNLRRLAHRAMAGLARTGSSMTNGSGDYVIAFSTAEGVRRTPERRAGLGPYEELSNDQVTPLFQAAIEATEEAILNSLFMATTVESRGPDGALRRVEAIDLDAVRAFLRDR